MARRGRFGSREFGGGSYWAPYVPVAERKRSAAREVAALAKKGKRIKPIAISGRTIAATFWGKAWCDNLESYSDYENRLPRGRTYVRNGSVVHLEIADGKVEALVQGSSLYTVTIGIGAVDAAAWKAIRAACAGRIGSVVELLRGKLSGEVMGIIARKDHGLFPAPKHITLDCSCPDWATMCKHVAAVLYGVGARLDEEPELLFTLRRADATELVAEATKAGTLRSTGKKVAKVLDADLASVFGIDLEAPVAKSDGAPVAKGRAQASPARVPAAQGKAPRARPVAVRRISRAVLIDSGVSPATIQSWLKTGLLGKTEVRGVYAESPRATDRLRKVRAGR